MSVKASNWIHGTSVQVETNSWFASRTGTGTIVKPGGPNASGYVHFAIPTPTSLALVPTKGKLAMILVKLGPKAIIDHFQVIDGEDRIVDIPVNFRDNGSPTPQFFPVPIPSTAGKINWGVGISFNIRFDGVTPDASVKLIGAGIEFIY